MHTVTLLLPVERGNEGDWKKALGGHFAPQEEVSLQIVGGEVVLAERMVT